MVNMRRGAVGKGTDVGYRAKLTVIVTTLLLVAIAATSLAAAWRGRQADLQQARAAGERVAELLARSASFGRQVPLQIETVIGRMMITEARLAARFVAAAEAAGADAETITRALAEIARDDGLEFWITDQRGYAYLHNVPGVEFTFHPDPAVQSQAHIFWKLLSGQATEVVDAVKVREIDGKAFKYAAVGGVDKPRIVQVGVEVGFLDDIGLRTGLAALIQAMVGGGDINAIWVVSEGLATMAHASVYGAAVNPEPTAEELALVREVIVSGRHASLLDEGVLHVLAPILDQDKTIGAAIVRLSTKSLRETLAAQAKWSIAAALVALVIGAAVSVFAADRVTAPVLRIAAAARAMEAGRAAAADLDPLVGRKDELGDLARTFQSMATAIIAREERLDGLVRARTQELESRNRELVAAHARIDTELDAARAFQIAILPRDFIKEATHQVYGFMAPAREVGGDFYDHFRLADDRLALIVGDVSGKGVPPALFMVLARTAIRTAMLSGCSPGAVLAEVNDRLLEDNPLELFVTVFCAIYDPPSGRLRYASGGHPPPLVLPREGNAERLPPSKGTALGIFPGLAYGEAEAEIAPGAVLFLYTDGFTDAVDRNGAMFGEQKVAASLATCRVLSAQDVAVRMLSTVDAYAQGTEQADDLTCLVLRRALVAADVDEHIGAMAEHG